MNHPVRCERRTAELPLSFTSPYRKALASNEDGAAARARRRGGCAILAHGALPWQPLLVLHPWLSPARRAHTLVSGGDDKDEPTSKRATERDRERQGRTTQTRTERAFGVTQERGRAMMKRHGAASAINPLLAREGKTTPNERLVCVRARTSLCTFI